MLNISNKTITNVNRSKYEVFETVENKVTNKVIKKLILWSLLIGGLILLIPWTQNIRSVGTVNTLQLDQRPQTINTVIAGKIEKWYVREGDFVKKGDTIVRLSEVKDDYFDPLLVERTKNQRDLKELSIGSYEEKLSALENQVSALTEQRVLKLKQTKIKYDQAVLKTEIDSNAYAAAQINFTIAKEQLNRMKELYAQGLKSLTDLESRDLKMQQTKAYEIEALNKFLTSKNNMINAQVEYSSVLMDYQSSIAKVNSDRATAFSDKFDAEATVNKLNNEYTNYIFRRNNHFILAPQDGYITQSIQAGIGEIIKEGEQIISIMPKTYDLIIEMFVDPIDLPLIMKGDRVNIQFDGWPAIIFSGWPNASYGTYQGLVYATDNFISPNGKFRVLVKPNPDYPKWPKALRVGGGTNSMVLLGDVPIGYELWRQINGFPPSFYQASEKKDSEKKK